VSGEQIAWLGPVSELPPCPGAKMIDGNGAWMTPGLIDCHTHLVYGGDRINEFEARLNGASYEQIAAQGGGILSTVAATRAADEATLVASAHSRAEQLMRDGVTTVEIKSGYGLDLNTELRMLRAAQQLGEQLPLDVITTFLGAHALPPEFADNKAGYIECVCNDMIPAVAKQKLASAVDGFCESIAFNADEIRQVFRAAKDAGLPVKLHAEQLSNSGGTQLACEFKALSADHLEYLTEAGVQAMAESGTVAVLLPGAFYALRETQKPPIELLRKYKIPMAVATDSNPGTSPALSLRAMINMACILFELTPEEALAGVTTQAAKALGLKDRGVLAVGKLADFCLWDIGQPAQLAMEIGGSRCVGIVKRGQILASK
jgi:imidazolonepropionase